MVYLLTQWLIVRADSIGRDLAWQYRILRDAGHPCRVFAGVSRPDIYPDMPIEPFERLRSALVEEPGPVVYHWSDGWPQADNMLASIQTPVFIRWHNITPPWFFAPYSIEPAANTIRSYRRVIEMARCSHVSFLANSEYSKRQLAALGIDPQRVTVIPPVSPLSSKFDLKSDSKVPSVHEGEDYLNVLFVGRMVPHKGHKHVVAAAAKAKSHSGLNVTCLFPGLPDGSMLRYMDEVRDLARRLGVGLDMPGEISQEELVAYYRRAHVFVCLSEHEGFGLPVLEAMLAGLPVVAYRSSAVAEVVGEHPLAVDTLDYDAIARNLLRARDHEVRTSVLTWQQEHVLPRFRPEDIGQRFLSVVLSTSERRAFGTADTLELPQDIPGRVVTQWDLLAFGALIETGDRAGVGDLHTRAMRRRFRSSRPLIGPVVSAAKRAFLILSDGVVAAVSEGTAILEQRFDGLERLLVEHQPQGASRDRTTAAYMGRGRVLTRTVHGHKMLVSADDISISPHLILGGTWEPWVTKALIARLKPGMRVLDAGAHFGYYTLLMAQAVGPTGHVFAFEPFPPSLELLKYNVIVNGFSGIVSIHECGLGDTEEDLEISMPAGPAGYYSGSASLMGSSANSVRSVRVPVRCLDSMGLGRLDAAKIDVEGSEYNLWKGGIRSLKQCSIIYLEWSHLRNYPAMEFLNEIREAGFLVNLIDHDGECRKVDDDELIKAVERYGLADLLLENAKRRESLV